MSLSYEELEALVAVVEQESFRAAAKKVHKSQSSISYSIANLEKKLKTQIFYRTSQKVTLTDAGRVVYNKALSILKLNSEIYEFSELASTGVESKINLVLTATTPTPVLITVLREFNERFPQTQIELKYTTYEEPVDLLLKREADLVVSSSRIYVDGLDRIKWLSMDFIAVTSPQHPAGLEGITEEDLYSLTNLVVGGRKTLEKKVSEAVLESANVWHVTDFLIKRELLVNGLGWGFMPKMLIRRELEEGLLVPVSAKAVLIKQLDVVKVKSGFIGPATTYLWNLFAKHGDNQINQELAEDLLKSYLPDELKQEW